MERRPVESRGRCDLRELIGSGVFEALDKFSAATRIAGDGIHRHRESVGQDACLDQRPQQGDGGRRVAARIRHTLGGGDTRRLVLGHLRKSIGPLGCHPVRSRGIDDPNVGCLDQRDRFARRLIGQAKNGEICRIEHIAPGLKILTPSLGQGEQFEGRMPE
jgi:hypothetical protein